MISDIIRHIDKTRNIRLIPITHKNYYVNNGFMLDTDFKISDIPESDINPSILKDEEKLFYTLSKKAILAFDVSKHEIIKDNTHNVLFVKFKEVDFGTYKGHFDKARRSLKLKKIFNAIHS
jgi:hypothetical protein